MEKKVYELKVDPELRDLIPPLSEEEHRMLEDSILRDAVLFFTFGWFAACGTAAAAAPTGGF